jgi:hypothetical protein
MRRRGLGALLTGGLLICTLGAATAASGDGGPGPGVSFGWDGIAYGNVRYVAIPTARWTSVQAIDRNGGRVLRFMELKGTWGIPLVANDGTTGGLLRDGHTLLLADGNYAGRNLRKQSSFTLVDMTRMRRLQTVRLAGDFAFDALSPDGHYLYLTEHTTAQDFTRYRVRAYDLRAQRLLSKIVSDRRSWETTMQGTPISRLSSDGWAYTLYGGSSVPAFIHALDTRHVDAVCIDLPWKYLPANVWSYRLRSDGDGHLVVRGPHGRALVTVDRRSDRILSSVPNP